MLEVKIFWKELTDTLLTRFVVIDDGVIDEDIGGVSIVFEGKKSVDWLIDNESLN